MLNAQTAMLFNCKIFSYIQSEWNVRYMFQRRFRVLITLMSSATAVGSGIHFIWGFLIFPLSIWHLNREDEKLASAVLDLLHPSWRRACQLTPKAALPFHSWPVPVCAELHVKLTQEANHVPVCAELHVKLTQEANHVSPEASDRFLCLMTFDNPLSCAVSRLRVWVRHACECECDTTASVSVSRLRVRVCHACGCVHSVLPQ